MDFLKWFDFCLRNPKGRFPSGKEIPGKLTLAECSILPRN